MRFPLMLDQTGSRHNVGVGLRVGGAGCVAAMLRIIAVRILWPETVHDKTQVAATLGAIFVGCTKLRGPGEIEQVEVKLPPVIQTGQFCEFTGDTCYIWVL